MVMSMTGFGNSQIESQGRAISVEIRTLNHRYLDINIRLPRTIAFVEEDIRKIIQEHISRGRVDVYIDYRNIGEPIFEVEPNTPLIELYLKAFDEVERQYNIRNDVTMNSLLNIPDVFLIDQKPEDDEVVKKLIHKAVDSALCVLTDMRFIEGKKLKEDILTRTQNIKKIVEEIGLRAPLVVEEYREKLQSRIEELLSPGSDIDENRFNIEVAYFADRSNIDEEVTRLYSHITQLESILEGEGPMGRKLDFLVQEMNREANTIGSKSNDIDITNWVVELKSEIEKIREQIQNIE
ncbi:MAG TPA: YicC family protein [Clostridiales bacterium]|nr:YicC family protein [Clostridiales bacterium]